MNTISTSIPLKYLTNRRRKVEHISFRDPYWEQRRKHQVVPDKKKDVIKFDKPKIFKGELDHVKRNN